MRVGRDGVLYDANPLNAGMPQPGVAKKAKPALKKKPAAKTRKGSTQGAESNWEYYGDGGWHDFSPTAMTWLSNELDSNSAEVTREGRDSKKKASERRIRLVAPGPNKPCDTDAEQRAWAARLGFYIIKASLLKRLKEM